MSPGPEDTHTGTFVRDTPRDPSLQAQLQPLSATQPSMWQSVLQHKSMPASSSWNSNYFLRSCGFRFQEKTNASAINTHIPATKQCPPETPMEGGGKETRQRENRAWLIEWGGLRQNVWKIFQPKSQCSAGGKEEILAKMPPTTV